MEWKGRGAYGLVEAGCGAAEPAGWESRGERGERQGCPQMSTGLPGVSAAMRRLLSLRWARQQSGEAGAAWFPRKYYGSLDPNPEVTAAPLWQCGQDKNRVVCKTQSTKMRNQKSPGKVFICQGAVAKYHKLSG